jgi:hypothetical protein
MHKTWSPGNYQLNVFSVYELFSFFLFMWVLDLVTKFSYFSKDQYPFTNSPHITVLQN